MVDASDERGLVVLTGSQTYRLMKGVSESLAGRLAIVDMAGLSLRERFGVHVRGPFVPGSVEALGPQISHGELWEIIWRGSMPELVGGAVEWGAFWSGYERAYLERDVRDLVSVRDIWFYCDARKREIGLIIQEGRVLHPVEVKKKALPAREDIANFAVLDGVTDYEVGSGAVICQTDWPLPIADDIWALPPWEI